MQRAVEAVGPRHAPPQEECGDNEDRPEEFSIGRVEAVDADDEIGAPRHQHAHGSADKGSDVDQTETRHPPRQQLYGARARTGQRSTLCRRAGARRGWWRWPVVLVLLGWVPLIIRRLPPPFSAKCRSLVPLRAHSGIALLWPRECATIRRAKHRAPKSEEVGQIHWIIATSELVTAR